jgi:iron(III) transport system permease protein
LIRYIILPIIRPSVLSIGLFIFAKTVACFGVAALLALPAREYILSTYIYKSMSSLNIKLALSISVIMMLLTCVLYVLQLRTSRRNADSDTTTENIGSNAVARVKLGKNRYWVFGLVIFFFVLTLFLPMLTIVQTSFMKTWELPFGLNNMTFENYMNLFLNEDIFYRAIRNSVLFGVVAATFAGILSLLSIFILNRVRGARISRGMIAFLCSVPMAIPEMILAVAAVFAWMNPPLKLYNTPWILIVSYITIAIPFLFRNMAGLIKNIPYVYEEMAMTDGASRQGAFWYVTVPQLRKGFNSGWILAFLFIIKEIPISSMLYSSGNETVGVLLFNLRFDTGGIETLSAISVLIILLTFFGKSVTGVFRPRRRFSFNQPKLIACLKKRKDQCHF